MGEGRDYGMQTFEQHVIAAGGPGRIDVETARAATMPSAAYARSADADGPRAGADLGPRRGSAGGRHRRAAAAARDAVAGFLRDLGYDVETQPFRFAPSVLTAAPLIGAGLGGVALLVLPLLVMPGGEGGAPASGSRGWPPSRRSASASGSAGPRSARRSGRTRTSIARRPGAEVNRWLVAHLDTKAQVQSMAGRLVAVWVAGAAVAAADGPRAGAGLAPVPLWAAAAAGLLAVAGGALVARGRLRGGSPGARDNATGLLAVLTAAERSAAPGSASW